MNEVCPESENLRENSDSSGTLLFISYLSFPLMKFSFTTFQTKFLFKGLSLYPNEPALTTLRGSPTGKASAAHRMDPGLLSLARHFVHHENVSALH